MPYSQIRFIGYSIDTAPRENSDGSYTYLGLENPEYDIEARCALMQSAMNLAYDNIHTSSPPESPGSTLNVFMAPEFFFRGNKGAYQMDDVQIAVSQLQTIVSAEKWDDWVFAFGTIVGVSELPKKWYDFFGWWQKNEAYNFCLFQEGGTAHSGPDGAQVIMKELMSGIDFISSVANPDGYLLGRMQHLKPGDQAQGPGREQSKIAYDGAGIFTKKDITWGLDICLDHLKNRLQKSPQLPGEEKVRIQLVPSCGATIKNSDIIAATNGYIFNVDGYSGSHTKLSLVPDTQIPASASFEVNSSDTPFILPNTSPPVSVKPKDLYRHGAGRVVLYKPQSLPDPETVSGSKVTLPWNASEAFKFTFQIIYDDNKNFQIVLFNIDSTTIDTVNKYNYFLPLELRTLDRNNKSVEISVKLVKGSDSYDHGLWCHIVANDFSFDGVAVEFSDNPATPPNVCW